MTIIWSSIYIRTDDPAAAVNALVTAYQDAGYVHFDPFPGGTGTPPGIKDIARHFVSPASEGWVRILGTPVVGLRLTVNYLYAWVTSSASHIDVFLSGHTDPNGLVMYLRPGKTAEDLAAVPKNPTGELNEPQPKATALPHEIEKLAKDHGVNPGQANQLINRMTSGLMARLNKHSGGEAGQVQGQARALLSNAQAAQMNWNSRGALRLLRLVELLTLPANWRTGDFDQVREAYQVARRLQRNPSASLMPDERAALAQISDPLAFTPVYMGK